MKLLEQMLQETSNEAMLQLQKKVNYKSRHFLCARDS